MFLFCVFCLQNPHLKAINFFTKLFQTSKFLNKKYVRFFIVRKFSTSSRSVFFKLFSSRPILRSQIFSRPLKKDLHLKSISDSAIFPPTSRCSLKKKKGLHFNFISDFFIFLRKSGCSLTKKKVFTSILYPISLFFSKNQSVL